MPNISGTINNCGCNAAIPTVLKAFSQLDNPSCNISYKSAYQELKNMFCDFYGLNSSKTTFDELYQFIQRKPFYEQELILRPVLRKYFINNYHTDYQEKFDKLVEKLAEKVCDGNQAEARQMAESAYAIEDQANPEINTIGRYETISPTHLNWHLYSKLGINFELIGQEDAVAAFNLSKAETPDAVETIKLYFNGDHYELQDPKTLSEEDWEGVGLALHNAISEQDQQTNVERILQDFKTRITSELKAAQSVVLPSAAGGGLSAINKDLKHDKYKFY